MKNLLKMCSGVRHRLHVLLSVDQKTHTDRVRHVAENALLAKVSCDVCVCRGLGLVRCRVCIFSRHSCVLSLLPLFYKAPDQRGTEASDDDDEEEEKYTRGLYP